MVGITLSAEQIRGAPPEVRRWLQQEIASSLNMQPERDDAGAKTEHLVVCDPDDAVAIFGAIREMPPVVNVFFELGGEGENTGTQGVVAHKLEDNASSLALTDCGTARRPFAKDQSGGARRAE